MLTSPNLPVSRSCAPIQQAAFTSSHIPFSAHNGAISAKTSGHTASIRTPFSLSLQGRSHSPLTRLAAQSSRSSHPALSSFSQAPGPRVPQLRTSLLSMSAQASDNDEIVSLPEKGPINPETSQPEALPESYEQHEDILQQAEAAEIRFKRGETLSPTELKLYNQAINILRERSELVYSFNDVTGNLRNQYALDGEQNRALPWLPADLTPHISEDLETLVSEVSAIREEINRLDPSALEAMIGNALVEDGLANYAVGITKPWYTSFPSDNQMTKWAGGWLGEEQRHEKVLRDLCHISGRVDMNKFDDTAFTLLTHGFDGGYGKDIVKLLVYTMVQELATYHSHRNTAKAASDKGCTILPKIFLKIAGDEFRHYQFYIKNFAEILKINPDLALSAYRRIMDDGFAMPAKKMDRVGEAKYEDYTAHAEKAGIFSANELVKTLRQVNAFLKLDQVEPKSEEGQAAKKHLLNLPDRYEKIATMKARRDAKNPAKELPEIWSKPAPDNKV